MTISTAPHATLFYFSNTDELSDYESFKVQPIQDSHREGIKTGKPEFWSVIGKLKPSKAKDVTFSEFPVADFTTQMYAELFADMCTKLTSVNSDGTPKSVLKEAVTSHAVHA